MVGVCHVVSMLHSHSPNPHYESGASNGGRVSRLINVAFPLSQSTPRVRCIHWWACVTSYQCCIPTLPIHTTSQVHPMVGVCHVVSMLHSHSPNPHHESGASNGGRVSRLINVAFPLSQSTLRVRCIQWWACVTSYQCCIPTLPIHTTSQVHPMMGVCHILSMLHSHSPNPHYESGASNGGLVSRRINVAFPLSQSTPRVRCIHWWACVTFYQCCIPTLPIHTTSQCGACGKGFIDGC